MNVQGGTPSSGSSRGSGPRTGHSRRYRGPACLTRRRCGPVRLRSPEERPSSPLLGLGRSAADARNQMGEQLC